ncbi:MAG: transporter substrate-binding domain-containing protein [Fibrobacter sp.]|nr:transporter substrate-binding domain-containing protein [Fibrobacter sp.]
MNNKTPCNQSTQKFFIELKYIHTYAKYFFRILTVIILIGCEKTDARTIRVGVYDNPPKIEMSNTGTPKGIFIDIIEYIAKCEKLDIKYIFGTWDECLTRLDDGSIDLMPDMAFSDVRNQRFDFNQLVVLSSWLQVFCRKDIFIGSVADLEGKTIAVLEGSIQQQVSGEIRKRFGISYNQVVLHDYATTIKQVESGKADAAIVSRFFGLHMNKEYALVPTPVILDPTNLHFATSKGRNGDLLAAIDKHLALMENDPHSMYYRSLAFWIQEKPRTFIPPFIVWLIASIITMLLIFFVFILLLRLKVSTRTKSLKSAADQLLESREYLKTVLDSVGDAIFVEDSETGRFIDVNRRACEMYGYTYDELLRIDIENLSIGESPFSQNDVLTWFKDAIETGPQSREWLTKHKDGRTFWAEVQIRFAVIGGKKRFVVVVRDISVRKKSEEELLKVQKLESLGILAGGIAHDFNNLMSGFFGYVDMARENAKDENVSQYLQKAMEAIDRVRALTHQLLTFAKGGAPIQKIGHLFPFVQETVKFSLSGSNVACLFTVQEDLWACNFDKNQIGQVIDNLVINAQQAMPEGGTIEVNARNIILAEKEHPLLVKGNYIKLSVKDSGIGISKEIITKIFDPFFTTKPKGHGLGLASCYSIVGQHGGCIDVESELGKGSTFIVYLPAIVGYIQGEEGTNVKTHKGSGTFLIMDDEKIVRGAIEAMLNSLGYNVIHKENGIKTIEFFKENSNITGMIFDLTIPGGMGGKETVAEIRKLNRDIPVFVVSGYAEDPIMKNPADYGFTASICKPFVLAELIEMLEKHMKKQE